MGELGFSVLTCTNDSPSIECDRIVRRSSRRRQLVVCPQPACLSGRSPKRGKVDGTCMKLSVLTCINDLESVEIKTLKNTHFEGYLTECVGCHVSSPQRDASISRLIFVY